MNNELLHLETWFIFDEMIFALYGRAQGHAPTNYSCRGDLCGRPISQQRQTSTVGAWQRHALHLKYRRT